MQKRNCFTVRLRRVRFILVVRKFCIYRQCIYGVKTEWFAQFFDTVKSMPMHSIFKLTWMMQIFIRFCDIVPYSIEGGLFSKREFLCELLKFSSFPETKRTHRTCDACVLFACNLHFVIGHSKFTIKIKRTKADAKCVLGSCKWLIDWFQFGSIRFDSILNIVNTFGWIYANNVLQNRVYVFGHKFDTLKCNGPTWWRFCKM